MWARVKEETKKGKQEWRVGDLLVDFLRSTHVGRTAPLVEGNWDGGGSEGDPGEAGDDGAQEAEADGVEEQAE